jgi:nucleoside-diphosphate-sugar epimerase
VAGKSSRVFLTGATGFIGTHAARQFAAEGRQVVVLTRDPRRLAADLTSRVEVFQGEMADPRLSSQLKGCAALVHCALSDDPDPVRRAETNRAGTRHLLDAAIGAGVPRFIHLSSISAYGPTPAGIVDETFQRVAPDDPYCRMKFDLEAEVLARTSAIETVVLQPGNVYGPGRCWWSEGLLDLMRRGKLILVNGGAGIANMVHVLDVVQAMQSALDTPGIGGESFLVIDGQPVSWREYYSGLERIAGRQSTISMTADEARHVSRRLQDRSLPARARRRVVRALLGRPIVFPLSDNSVDTFCRQTVFSIAKARRRLGYIPAYDLEAGLETVSAYEIRNEDEDRVRRP